MRIALFGGSFNPVHVGHVLCAERLVSRAGFDRVFVIPCRVQPIKGALEIPEETRFELLKRAMARLAPKVEVSRTELDRKGPSYSFDTIGKFKKGLGPNDQLAFVMGTDAFAGIRQWHRYPEILSECGFLVVGRKGVFSELSALFEAHPQVARIDLDLPEVSATEIREKLASGADLTGLIPGEIERDLRALHAASARATR